MHIIDKKFRTINPIEENLEDDVQGTKYISELNIYLYIYNHSLITRFSSDADENSNNIFGSFSLDQQQYQRKNLKNSIVKNNDPVSIGKYQLFENQILGTWNFQRGEKKFNITFKGKILLNGDALIGIFYRNGIVSVPERVYYNIDKPLPNPLLKEYESK